ncbi:MAG: hypothetical protein G01um101416_1098 [Microgenomates group bacterium Gr01-1014_16]|nr:MAG: hypothetical protein G01um101416_1098 [Microgenomates group bacterium Gr01-1014_16]
MFKQAILPDTLRAIQLAAKVPIVQRAYLAGGTALALRLGHRISVDLDFFTQEEFDEQLVLADLRKYGLEKEATAWMTVKGKFGETDISLFWYKYPILDVMDKFEGLNILGKRDVAAMKINALYDRGTGRDFADIYFLAKEFSFEEMMDFYDRKYGNLEDRKYSILRSLDSFEEAEAEKKEPQMLMDYDWEEAKKFFRAEAMRLAKSL